MPTDSQKVNFKMTDNFSKGYRDKRDVLKEVPGTAVSGSQNIVILDGEKISNRPGYTLLGAANANTTGIKGGGSWLTSRGLEIPWRSYDDELEFYYNSTWNRLADSFTSSVFRGASIYDTTESQDLMIFVNGDANLRMWSGGITTFASATSSTITKEGTTFWTEEGFLAAGTRQVIIGGTTYTYTGGEGTTTLTGVTPDPTVAGHAVGSVIHQALRTTANTPASGFDNDFVSVLGSQLFVFDKNSRQVHVSALSSYADFSTLSSPRVPGDTATFTLDQTPTAAIALDDSDGDLSTRRMAISTRDYWYQILFQLSQDLTKESVIIKRLKTTSLQGASFDLGVDKMKNPIVYVSNEPTVEQLGNIENLNTPQNVALSDPIKNTLGVYGVDEASCKYHRNDFYISAKNSTSSGANNRVLVWDVENGLWQSPWTVGGILFEYDGGLYLHSSVQPETYQLLNGYNDNDKPYTAKWFDAHNDFGRPHNHKVFDTMMVEGYIKPDTEVTVFLSYDFGAETKSFTISGKNGNIVLKAAGTGLGQFSLGTRNLGGTGEALSESGLRYFEGFIAVPSRPFRRLQTSFQSSGTDGRWEIVNFGYNVTLMNNLDNKRKVN